MEKLFPEITSMEDVMRLAKGGAIAGLIFIILILLDRLLGTLFIVSPVRQAHLFGGALAAVFEIAIILFLASRVWSGRGSVSAILLMALFVIATMTHTRGGLFGFAWTAAYFGIGLMMLNAIRACLRYGAISSFDRLESSAS